MSTGFGKGEKGDDDEARECRGNKQAIYKLCHAKEAHERTLAIILYCYSLKSLPPLLPLSLEQNS